MAKRQVERQSTRRKGGRSGQRGGEGQRQEQTAAAAAKGDGRGADWQADTVECGGQQAGSGQQGRAAEATISNEAAEKRSAAATGAAGEVGG